MGIKSLHQFLKRHCPSVYEKIPLNHLSHRRIAVDISIYVFKYRILHGDRWLDRFFDLLLLARRHHIEWVMVYDNAVSPPEKHHERQLRKEARSRLRKKLASIMLIWGIIFPLIGSPHESMGWDWIDTTKTAFSVPDPIVIPTTTECDEADQNEFIHFVESMITIYNPVQDNCMETHPSTIRRILTLSNMNDEITKLRNTLHYISAVEFNTTRRLFESFGIPIVEALGEAEATCVALTHHGYTNGCLTDDTDVLAYGSPCMMLNLDIEQETVVCIHYDHILRLLQMTPAMFLDLCIMCGTDYNQSLPRIGCERAYRLLLKYSSIDTIQKRFPDLPIHLLNHTQLRRMFNVTNIPLSPICAPPALTLKNIQEFCSDHTCDWYPRVLTEYMAVV